MEESVEDNVVEESTSQFSDESGNEHEEDEDAAICPTPSTKRPLGLAPNMSQRQKEKLRDEQELEVLKGLTKC